MLPLPLSMKLQSRGLTFNLKMHVLYDHAPWQRAELHLPTKPQTAVLAFSKSLGMN
jgi:hypothetical protein